MARRNQTNVSIGFRLSADGSQLIGQTRVSKEELRKLGVEFSDTGRRATGYSTETGRATRATEGLSSGLSRMRGLLATLGVSLSVVGLQRLITSTTRAADEIAKLSGVTSVSTDDLQRLEFAASQTGLEFRQITQAISFMQRQMVENEQVRDFADALDLRDLDTVGQLSVIADQFAHITDPAERAAAAARLFGRSAGVEMLNFLDQGSEGIQRYADRADELGIVLDERLLRNAERFNDVWDEVSRTLGASVRSGVLEALITDSGELTDEMQALVDLLTSEDLQTGITNMVTGLVSITTAAGNAVINLQRMGERVAQMMHGAAIDDVEAQMRRIAEIDRALANERQSLASAHITQHERGIQLSQQRILELERERDQLEQNILAYGDFGDANSMAGDAADDLADGLNDVAGAGESAGDAIRRLFLLVQQDGKKANREQERFVSSFESLRGQLDPTWAATKRYTEAVELLDRAWWELGLSGEVLEDLMFRLASGAEEAADASEDAAARMADDPDVVAVAWDEAARRIDGTMVDVWADIISGTGNAMDHINRLFHRMLAEMAHAAATRPILVRMGMGFGAGMPGMAAAGQTGGVGTMANLIGGNQIGMGFQSAGDWLFSNTNLPVGGLMEAGQFSNTAFGAAGLLGGLGAHMLFGGRGASGLGGGLGSMAGLAVGGPFGAIAGSLLGGGLGSMFGSRPSNRAAMADIDLGAGSVTGFDQMTGSKAPDSETLEARDTLAAFIAGASQGLSGLGASLAGNIRLDIGGRDGIQVDWGDGLEHMGDDLDTALDNIIERLVDGAEGLDDALASLILGIEGGEDRIRMIGALGAITGLRTAGSSLDAGRDAWERSQMSMSDQWREQTAATDELIRTYDGSLEATERLAEAYGVQRQMSVELAASLEGLSRSIEAMFSSTANMIRESLMGEEELYEHRSARFDDLIASLAVADSEAEIHRLSREIDQLFGTIWGSLDEAQRLAMGDEFLDAVIEAEQLAQSRIEELRADISDADTHLADSAQEALRAAGMQSEAAQEQLAASQQFAGAVAQFVQAVNTPLRVNIQGGGGEVHTR